MSPHLYNILVSQRASTVIPRLLVRKQMQGRDWENQELLKPSPGPPSPQVQMLPEHLGQVAQAPTWWPIVTQPFWSFTSEEEKSWVELPCNYFPSTPNACFGFSIKHKSLKGRDVPSMPHHCEVLERLRMLHFLAEWVNGLEKTPQ